MKRQEVMKLQGKISFRLKKNKLFEQDKLQVQVQTQYKNCRAKMLTKKKLSFEEKKSSFQIESFFRFL